jgi:hypothetical protein
LQKKKKEKKRFLPRVLFQNKRTMHANGDASDAPARQGAGVEPGLPSACHFLGRERPAKGHSGREESMLSLDCF